MSNTRTSCPFLIWQARKNDNSCGISNTRTSYQLLFIYFLILIIINYNISLYIQISSSHKFLFRFWICQYLKRFVLHFINFPRFYCKESAEDIPSLYSEASFMWSLIFIFPLCLWWLLKRWAIRRDFVKS